MTTCYNARMKNSILVPLDGSKLSERALTVADTILQGKEQGTLIVLRSLETPRLSAWLPVEMMSLHQREREIVREYLSKTKQERSGKGYQVETILGPGPGPVDDVVETCEARGVRLVVMSGHGYSGWVQAILGSNAEKILRRCASPILVVKGEAETPPTGFHKILVPLDGSKRAESALTKAMAVAPGGEARILLVGVSVVFQGHAFEGDLRVVVKPDMARIQTYLDEQAEWLANQGYQVDTVVTRGAPADEILKLAAEQSIDLILMTTQGQGDLPLWHYGSVAERLVRHCECSVLVLKEDKPQEQEPS